MDLEWVGLRRLGDPHPAVGRRRRHAPRTGRRASAIPAVATRVIDSTGAGDVHVGAMLAGLARGLPLPEAVLLANRAAAYAVGRWGAATGPTEDELREFGGGRW